MASAQKRQAEALERIEHILCEIAHMMWEALPTDRQVECAAESVSPPFDEE
jgi:hypothetical protein